MKGQSVYFTKNELENLNDFFNHWDDELTSDDEPFYAYWTHKIGSAHHKVYDALEKSNRQN